jgi:hypothetical protein
MKPELSQQTTESNSHLFDDWFDPIESGIRAVVQAPLASISTGAVKGHSVACAPPCADAVRRSLPIVGVCVDGHHRMWRVRFLPFAFEVIVMPKEWEPR